MSNTKKTVKISEKDLVNLIENIVKEAVEAEKTQWLNENSAKNLLDEVNKIKEKLENLNKK